FVSDYGLPAALVTTVVRRPWVLRVAGDFAWESAVRRGLVPAETEIDAFQRQPKRGRVALLDAIQRFYVRRAARVVVPSEYLAGIVRGWGADPARVRVVLNAVDLDVSAEDRTRDEARATLDLGGEVVLSIARLTRWKGVDHLIRSI